MAKLLVAPHLIVDALFKGSTPSTVILGASFDGQFVVLEIEGADVPDAEEVTATLSLERIRVAFNAVK